MKEQHGRNLTGAEMAQILDEFVNGAGAKEVSEFTDALVNRTHRTLQQRIMGLFVAGIEAWAGLPSDRFDLRNEATVKLCKRIVSATGDKYDRYLPLI